MRVVSFVVLMVSTIILAYSQETKKSGSSTRIIGGIQVGLGEIPYQVRVQCTYPGCEGWACGGSLVQVKGVTIVVSVAHCFLGVSPSDLLVVAGVVNWTDTTNEWRQERNVSRIELHEEFDATGWVENDICLLFLNDSFETSEMVNPVELATADYDGIDGEVLTVSGWGDQFANQTFPEILRATNLTVVNNRYCQDMWGDTRHIFDTMMCAIGDQGGESGCHGDSGGPATGADGRYVYQIGIMSQGPETCGTEYPNIFTRVSKYITWMEEKVSSYLQESE